MIKVDSRSDENGVYLELLRSGGHYYIAHHALAWTPRAGEITLTSVPSRAAGEAILAEDDQATEEDVAYADAMAYIYGGR